MYIFWLFLGQKGYRLYDLDAHKFLSSRDVVFHEHIFPFSQSLFENQDDTIVLPTSISWPTTSTKTHSPPCSPEPSNTSPHPLWFIFHSLTSFSCGHRLRPLFILWRPDIISSTHHTSYSLPTFHEHSTLPISSLRPVLSLVRRVAMREVSLVPYKQPRLSSPNQYEIMASSEPLRRGAWVEHMTRSHRQRQLMRCVHIYSIVGPPWGIVPYSFQWVLSLKRRVTMREVSLMPYKQLRPLSLNRRGIIASWITFIHVISIN
jgi:hypothetical protein